MDNAANEGATPEPVQDPELGKCMGRYRHSWIWKWSEDRKVWSDEAVCENCAEVRVVAGCNGPTVL